MPREPSLDREVSGDADDPAKEARADPSLHILGLQNLVVEDVSLGLGKDHFLRRFALRLARSPLFSQFILANIYVNFVLLAAAGPFTRKGPGSAEDVSQKLEPWFQALFAAEALLMIVALGENLYFTDGWRILDAVVVVLCFLVYIPGTGNASALRAMRALRPLRTFGMIPVLRSSFAGILAIGEVTIIMSQLEWFIEFVFTLVGINLWAGVMSGSCFASEPFIHLPSGASTATLTSSVTSNTAGISGVTDITTKYGGMNLYRNRFIDNLIYNSNEARGFCFFGETTLMPDAPPPVTAISCPAVHSTASGALLKQMCLPYANPLSYGAQQLGMSYDNVGIGWLTTVVADSEEGWTSIVYALWSTWGVPWFTSLIFIALILFKDEFIGWLDGASFIAYTNAVAIEAERMGLSKTAEGIAVVQAAELKALAEMYGPAAAEGGVHEKAGRAAQASKDRLAIPARALSAFVGRLPEAPEFLRTPCSIIEKNRVFVNFYLCLVLANAIMLGCNSRDMSKSMEANIVQANYVFVALFIVELVVRMLALGITNYFSEGMNTFDCTVVCISIIEIIVNAVVPDASGVGLSAIRVLRILRVLRIFKLARSFKPLMDMIIIIGKALPEISSIGFILLVLVFVFAAIGQQVFGGTYADAIATGKINEYPRHNYDNFGWAMVSVFNLLDGENWFVPLYQHMAVGGPAAALFFFGVMFIGAIVWGIVLTIFMKGFDDQEDENNELEVDKQAGDKLGADPRPPGPPANFFFTRERNLVLLFPAYLAAPANSILDSGAKPSSDESIVSNRCDVSISTVVVKGVDAEGNPVRPPAGASPLSAALAALIDSQLWGWFSLAVSVLACINLGLNEPSLDHCTTSECDRLRTYLVVCDSIVIAFIAIEALVGFAARPLTFFTSGWNCLDVAIVATTIPSLVLGAASLRAIRVGRAIKALRVFRILRQITALEGMLDTMAGIVPAASSAFVIIFMFLYIYAVVGLQIFSGTLNVCNDPYAPTTNGVVDAAACVGTFTLKGPTCAYLPTPAQEAACRASPAGHPGFPRLFETQLPNYDNIGNALLTVFQLADGENWPTLMYNGVDAGNSVNDASERDRDQWRGLYFVIVILTFDIVVLDLLAGVVRTGYHHATARAGGRGVLTHGQRQLVINAQLVLESAPFEGVPPSASLLPGAHALVYGWPSFEWAVMAVVTATALCCAQWRSPMTTATAGNLNAAFFVLTVLLVLEVLLRFAASGPRHFSKSFWCCLDAALAATAVVGMALTLASAGPDRVGSSDYGVMRVALSLRALRALNMVREVRHTQRWLHHMQPTLRAMRRAVPKVAEVFFLKFVMIFVAAVVGCAAFGNTRHGYAGDNIGGNPGRSSGNLNPQANFESFPKALFTLFRSTTGENWNMLMLDMMVDEPYCLKTNGKDNTCGSTIFSPIYWIFFTIMTSLILDPLIAVVCLESFWRDCENEKFMAWHDPQGRKVYKFTHGAAEPFREAWAKKDPYGNGGVTRAELEAIVGQVEVPLGVVPEKPKAVLSELPELDREAEEGELEGEGASSAKEHSAAAAALVERLSLFSAEGDGEEVRVDYHTALFALVMAANVDFRGDQNEVVL